MRLFWRAYLRLTGWNTEVEFPYHHLKKYIFIVGPHTSNWDVVVGLAYRSLLRLGKVRFLGKRELFRFPLGWFFRWIGGIPVDRQQRSNFVDAAVRLFEERETFAIALSPEGTRRKVQKLRTGFYYIALKARIPVIMVGLDFSRKTVWFSEPFLPSDLEKDFNMILDFYRPIQGKYPAQGIG